MVLLVPACAPGGEERIDCRTQPRPIECLHRNFNHLYSADYEQFWEILHAEAAKLKSCRSPNDVVPFLRLRLVERRGAEFEEFYSETLEDLGVDNTECLLEALLAADDTTTAAVLDALQTPIFHTRQEVGAALARYGREPAYRDLVESYQSRGPS